MSPLPRKQLSPRTLKKKEKLRQELQAEIEAAGMPGEAVWRYNYGLLMVQVTPDQDVHPFSPAHHAWAEELKPNKSRPRVIDTRDEAVGLFETFHARDPAREFEVNWTWPKSMVEAGVGQAEMYESNKWKDDLKEYEAYKHIAEGSRLTYVRNGWLREWANPNKPIKMVGETVSFERPMPKHFAVLGKLIGVQLRLFERNSKGDLYVPNGDEGLYEVRVRHGMLGGAKHPETDTPFVFVYTKNAGVCMIITGSELDIAKDGIVG